ncbi:peptidoglycan binding domain containing protein [Stagonosporopsis vannaccii]|nr:peptidoglycan binding domain containing protein [Stagonosporopsis vannaccii]
MADVDQPWGRRLIICCDGTWQTSVSEKENVPSNVTKLCRLIKRYSEKKTDKARNWHQLVYYDSGIGTGNLSGVESARQGGTGAGLMENVIEAYNFIVLNYQEGDEIFCFGFSRGAFTARAVSGLVADIGVIKPLEMQYFPRIYRAYMRYGSEEVKTGNNYGIQSNIDAKVGKGFRESDAWKKLIEMGTFIDQPPTNTSRQIKVVGVWDTVGSLGMPDLAGQDLGALRKKYGFHNVKLSSHVSHAYHALALDERRSAFRPTLWYIDAKSYEKGGANQDKTMPELKQVWFPGVHINCGGGSDDGFLEMLGDMENISIATFTWMLQCISPHLDIDQAGFKAYLTQYSEWLNFIRTRCTYHHKWHESWLRQQYNKLPNIPYFGEEPDPLADPKREEPHTHDFDFGWGVGPIVDSYTDLFKKNGPPRPRRPGHEQMEIEGQWVDIKGTHDAPTKFKTCEYIHPLVEYRHLVLNRWDKWEWDTDHPLKDWRRAARTEDDGSRRFWWYRPGGGDDDRLPEWCILPDTKVEINYERTWYEATKKMNSNNSKKKQVPGYLEQLDKEIKFEPKRINEWEL